MRARLDELVAGRLAVGAALPALSCYEFGTALAVVAAAEDAGVPVALLVPPAAARGRDGSRLIAALRTLADGASVPVSVQLDHATDVGLVLEAVAAGADAVLADGSKLPLEDNAALVARVRELTAGSGTVVEAELGDIAGDEDRALSVHAAGGTDPELVAGFVAASGAQLLAVSVGNVHGRYAGEPRLDWPLVAAVRERCPVPLALHGASGLPEGDLARAGAAGLGKVNVNTELRAAVLDATQELLPRARAAGDDVLTLEAARRAAAHRFTGSLLRTLTPAPQDAH
ncbi:class II fructose-bisphosphate aldolase [Kineococcus auxinigenes]|uniref:class II fructose-bisphosphate aldolase n=1 Tax=unclassified Kineococcus TaxID=2621656 RepID=UPI003D7CF113